jgi:acetyl-CoA carboxylase biotin carboxylase subunit
VFSKVLVANRGEIAVRVIRACRELGVATAAIHSEADREALHVRLADEAHECGPAPARDSYLQAERVVAIARRTGADALHPGYGFLAENGDFAERCTAAGLRFIGPGGDVIRAMGDKLASRRIVAEAGVAVVPGSPEVGSDGEAAEAARVLGYPVMVKASAGGGGRGLRRVVDEPGLRKALPRARSEAKSAFGDDRLYLEKALDCPRHIEVQILADAAGQQVHLFERECSIQRRHQKLVEEAPAAGLEPALRESLGRAALAAARAVAYEGAGTCEFLVDKYGDFYFLEMNTRVQVEHAITEAITGVDLVQAMIRIAAGEPLAAVVAAPPAMRGHAIEARIYAEDPEKGFLPSPGRIETWRPPTGTGIRVDTGVEAGDAVTVHYDPLLAKGVAWGADRAQAIERLGEALDAWEVEGVRTTLPFHRWLVRHEAFRAGAVDTGFVDAHWKRR